jgi:hypothetical protein
MRPTEEDRKSDLAYIRMFLQFNDKGIWGIDKATSIRMNNALQKPLFKLKNSLEIEHSDYLHIMEVRKIMVDVCNQHPQAKDLHETMVKEIP